MKWNKHMQQYARVQKLKRKDKYIANKQRLAELQLMISHIDFESFLENMKKFAQIYVETVKRTCEEINRKLLESRGEYIEELPKKAE